MSPEARWEALARDLATEVEYPGPAAGPSQAAFTAPFKLAERIRSFFANLEGVDRTPGRACLAFSGGDDSLALLDLAAKKDLKPIVAWIDTGMEYPETRAFVQDTVARYNLELRIRTPKKTPQEQWNTTGWPMLGKQAARLWMQRSRGQDRGFKINVSECCRAMKIDPARSLTRGLGCSVQITGQRGRHDDALRGLRELKDGAFFYNQADRISIANPLSGWTEGDVQTYLAQAGIPRHPAKARGARTIGCVFCGGGSQYTNSGFRVLRQTWPEAWQRFMVEWGAGEIILALKYNATLEDARAAIAEEGGLAALAERRPWIFDFTRIHVLKGYDR